MVSARNELRADLTVRGAQEFKRDLNSAGDAAERAGDDLRSMGDDAGFLTRATAEARAEIQNLIQTLNQTGDLQLLKQIRKEQRQLRIFEKLSEELAGPATDAGSEIGDAVVQGMSVSLKAAGPVAIGGAVALAAAMAPVIGAAISAAVLGGVGTGGIIGGIVGAASDPRVEKAWTDAVESMLSDSKSIAAPFVDPVIESIGLLKAGVKDLMSGDLGSAIGQMASNLVPLTRGFVDLAERAAPGVVKAMRSAQPVLDAVASELPEIGDAIAYMLTKIAENPQEAAAAIETLSNVLQELLLVVGNTTDGLTDMFGTVVETGAPVAEVIADIYGWMPGLGEYAERNAERFSAMADELARPEWPRFATHLGEIEGTAEQAADELQGLAKAIDDVFDKQMGLDEATIRWHEGLRSLRKELLDGARTLALTSEEGLKNRDEMLGRIQVAESLRDAFFRQTGDLEGANKAFQEHIEVLAQMAIKAGFAKQEVDALVAPYRTGPVQATIEFRFPGLAAGLAMHRELTKQLGSRAAAASAAGNFFDDYTAGTYVSGRASGGDVEAGRTYMVGEKGPELVTFGSDGYVHDAESTRAMMAGSTGGGSWGGGSRQPIYLSMYLQPSGDSALDVLVQALWPRIMRQVRIDGGDVTVLGG